MEFNWQQSRGEALYVDGVSKRIFGFIHWKDDNRLNIDAMALSNSGPNAQFVAVGKYTDEQKAKEAVEAHVAAITTEKTAKALVDDNTRKMAHALSAGLEKQVAK